MNVALVGVLTRRLIPSRVVAVAVMLTVLVGPVYGDAITHVSWLQLHAVVLSEPLFITVSLLALIQLTDWLKIGRPHQLWMTAIFLSLSFLCRYVGIAVIVTAAVVILLWGPKPRTRRLRAAGTVLGVGLLPGVLWALYGSVVEHGNSARTLAFHLSPLGGALWHVGEGWLVPGSWPAACRVSAITVAVLLIAIVLADNGRRIAGRDHHPLIGLRTLAVVVVSYTAVIVATHEFVDRSTPLNDRIFAPMQPIGYILLFSALWYLTRRHVRRISAATTACVVVALLVASSAWTTTSRLVLNGLPSAPHGTPTINFVRRLPAGTFIAANTPDQVFLYMQRPSIRVPSRVNGTFGATNRNFDREVREMGQVVRTRHGVVVLTRAAFAILVLANEQDFLRHPALRVERRLPDGTVILTPK